MPHRQVAQKEPTRLGRETKKRPHVIASNPHHAAPSTSQGIAWSIGATRKQTSSNLLGRGRRTLGVSPSGRSRTSCGPSRPTCLGGVTLGASGSVVSASDKGSSLESEWTERDNNSGTVESSQKCSVARCCLNPTRRWLPFDRQARLERRLH